MAAWREAARHAPLIASTGLPDVSCVVPHLCVWWWPHRNPDVSNSRGCFLIWKVEGLLRASVWCVELILGSRMKKKRKSGKSGEARAFNRMLKFETPKKWLSFETKQFVVSIWDHELQFKSSKESRLNLPLSKAAFGRFHKSTETLFEKSSQSFPSCYANPVYCE